MHDVHVSDNEVTRGGVVYVASSILYTFRVNFSDSTQLSDLSAVQTASESTYIAEETTFAGFERQVGGRYVVNVGIIVDLLKSTDKILHEVPSPFV